MSENRQAPRPLSPVRSRPGSRAPARGILLAPERLIYDRAITIIVEAVNALAASKACTSAQVALAWLLAHGDHVVPIPRMTKAARLEGNAGAAFVGLSAADLARLADAVPPGSAAGERYPAGMPALVDE